MQLLITFGTMINGEHIAFFPLKNFEYFSQYMNESNSCRNILKKICQYRTFLQHQILNKYSIKKEKLYPKHRIKDRKKEFY